jgi:hypothetical protein
MLNKKTLCIKQAEEDANRVQGKQDTICLQQQKQLNKFPNKLYH